MKISGFQGFLFKGVYFCATDRPKDLEQLAPEEYDYIGPAHHDRQLEFATGRWCAHRVLTGLGLDPLAIPSGAGGEPIWPEGVAGSISHAITSTADPTEGFYCAAASRDKSALGLDVESLEMPIPDSLLPCLCTSGEIEWIRKWESETMAAGIGRYGVRTIFLCAKEAIFKCLFPKVGRYFDFLDVCVELEADSSSFSATLLKSLGHLYPQGLVLTGRYFVFSDWVLTVVWSERDTKISDPRGI